MRFQLCVDYLIENMSINSSCESMQAAVTYGQDQLKNSTLEYIEVNTQVGNTSVILISHYNTFLIFFF